MDLIDHEVHEVARQVVDVLASRRESGRGMRPNDHLMPYDPVIGADGADVRRGHRQVRA